MAAISVPNSATVSTRLLRTSRSAQIRANESLVGALAEQEGGRGGMGALSAIQHDIEKPPDHRTKDHSEIYTGKAVAFTRMFVL